jgi:hypothetical protein
MDCSYLCHLLEIDQRTMKHFSALLFAILLMFSTTANAQVIVAADNCNTIPNPTNTLCWETSDNLLMSWGGPTIGWGPAVSSLGAGTTVAAIQPPTNCTCTPSGDGPVTYYYKITALSSYSTQTNATPEFTCVGAALYGNHEDDSQAGDGSTTAFTWFEYYTPIGPTLLAITAYNSGGPNGYSTLGDDGNGNIIVTGGDGATGTINYVTGEIDVVFDYAPTFEDLILLNYTSGVSSVYPEYIYTATNLISCTPSAGAVTPEGEVGPYFLYRDDSGPDGNGGSGQESFLASIALPYTDPITPDGPNNPTSNEPPPTLNATAVFSAGVVAFNELAIQGEGLVPIMGGGADLFTNAILGVNAGDPRETYSVFLGQNAGSNGSGDSNVGIGENAGFNLNGTANVGIGVFALESDAGTGNVAIGYNPLQYLTAGNGNIAIGYNAGILLGTTESYNIDIGSIGVEGESNVIRIGTPGYQSAAYIAGKDELLTVASLPACGVANSNPPQTEIVSDANTLSDCIVGSAPVGGGSTWCHVACNGSQWVHF